MVVTDLGVALDEVAFSVSRLGIVSFAAEASDDDGVSFSATDDFKWMRAVACCASLSSLGEGDLDALDFLGILSCAEPSFPLRGEQVILNLSLRCGESTDVGVGVLFNSTLLVTLGILIRMWFFRAFPGVRS